MSLSRNDMLSTEGRAPRARRSCYVNEPAYGFFIAGSSIKAMNGEWNAEFDGRNAFLTAGQFPCSLAMLTRALDL